MKTFSILARLGIAFSILFVLSADEGLISFQLMRCGILSVVCAEGTAETQSQYRASSPLAESAVECYSKPIWEGGVELAFQKQLGSDVFNIAEFSIDGSLVALQRTGTSEVEIWDAIEMQHLETITLPDTTYVGAVGFNSRIIAAGSTYDDYGADVYILPWQGSSCKYKKLELPDFDEPDNVSANSILLSPGEGVLVINYFNRSGDNALVYNPSTGKEYMDVGWICSFCSDGSYAIGMGMHCCPMYLIHTSNWQRVASFGCGQDCSISLDGRYVAYTSTHAFDEDDVVSADDWTSGVYSVDRQEIIGVLDDVSFTDAHFSPDSKYVLAVDQMVHSGDWGEDYDHGDAVLYQFPSLETVNWISDSDHRVRDVRFDPSSRYVISRGDNDLKVTSLDRGQNVFSLGDELTPVRAFSVSADGGTIVVTTDNALYDLKYTGEIIERSIEMGKNKIIEVAVSAGGNYAAVLQADHTARIFNLSQLAPVTQLESSIEPDKVSFGPEGAYVVLSTGTADAWSQRENSITYELWKPI